MKRLGFNEFIDKKSREGRRQLNIIRDVLQKGGFKVGDFIEHADDDPYVFVHNPEPDARFHGLRIYRVGSGIAFRIQMEEKTQPFGTAYTLKIPEMFADLVEDMDQEEAGKKVMENIVKNIKKFFVLSARAEADMDDIEIQGAGDPLGKLIVAAPGVDISRQVGNSI